MPSSSVTVAAEIKIAGVGQAALVRAPLMRAAEYQATPRARADHKAAFWAPNRVNDLSLDFGLDGLEVAPLQGDRIWSLRLRAAAYGPAGATQTLAGAPALSADGQRVDYRWARLREWYTNSATGLKHNITLAQPIAADSLQVDLALGGSLRPRVSPDGLAASFDAAGTTVLDFGPLYVYDAAGRTLEAHFGTPRDGGATLPILVETQGARFPITIDSLLSSPRPKVTANDPEASALFGQQVAIDGEVLALAAPSKDERGQNSGAVYVFTRNRGGADNWSQVKKLVAADGAADDGFGRAVALHGNTLVVGAPLRNVLTTDDGAVYVFERHSGGPDNWGQLQRIDLAEQGHPSGQFGAAVAIHSDTIVVGAPFDDLRARDAGVVYSFARRHVSGVGVRWVFDEGILPGEALRSGAGFGRAVALDGHTLVVGAPGQGVVPNTPDAAYVFQQHRNTLGVWAEVRKLVCSDSRAADNFGTAVAIAGDTIVVGAPQHDVGATANQGAAYLFGRNQGGADGWAQTTKLTDSGGAANDFFGVAVAADGATALIGAPFDDDETRGLSDSGSLTIIVNRRFFAKLTAADAANGDSFGGAVAVDGDLIAGGARRHDHGAVDAGAVFLFTLASETWGEVRRHDGSLSCCRGQNIALDGDTLVAAEKNGAEGLIAIFQRNSEAPDTWGLIKRFSIPAEPIGTRIPLALSGDVLAVVGDGAVYIFERNIGGAEGWGQLTSLHGSFSSLADDLGMEVALDGNTLAAGAGGAVYVYRNSVRKPTGLGLHAEANPVQPGQPVTITGTISGEAGASEGAGVAQGVPQGEIAFFLNGAAVGTAQLDAQGQATVTPPGLAQGTYELSARFAGNDTWAPCEAPPLTLFVGVAPPPAPDSATVFLPWVSR